jgi:hypothetical protein
VATIINQSDDDKVYVSFPIVKTERTEDGDLLVWGKATDGSVDSDEQIVDPDWSGPALKTWLATGGNVRTMHSASLMPAGKGIEVKSDPDGAHWVKSLVVEPTAKKLVEKGVLRAYSIGISRPVIDRDTTGKARGGIIRGNDKTIVHEISLVDRPANSSCGITIVKGVDGVPVDAEDTFGDLMAALAQVEADEVTKSAADAAPGTPFEAWKTARHQWLGDEPSRGDAADGPAYLAKRAAWQKWNSEGEQLGLTEDGYPLWLAHHEATKGELSAADRDNLKNSDFAYVDSQGDRHLPVHDEGHVHSALGRFSETPFEDGAAKKKAARKIISRAKDMGISVDEDSAVAQAAKVEKAAKGGKQCADCNTFNDADATTCSNCSHNLADPKDTAHDAATKGAKDCLGCGKTYHGDSKMKRCEGCGKKLPKAKALKAEKKARRMVPADVKPAGEHREPDGSSTVEQLEPQAGMATDRDPVKDKVPASVKSADAGYSTWRAHDALCAAYHADAVAEAYPALKSVADAVDTDWWQQQVIAAATKGDMGDVAHLAQVAAGAAALKATDPAALADARADLHKSFTDLHGKSATPGEITPGQFQRPYISAGHAPLSARTGQTPRVPPGTHTPDPDQFDRHLITDGHQDASPSASGDNNPVATVSSGAARTYYTRASRDAARSAMQSMHDHIAVTFPDMCPMAASKSVLPPDMGDTNRPHPVTPPAAPKAPGEKAAAGHLAKRKKAKAPKTTAPAVDADLIKSIATDVAKSMRDTYETEIAALRAEIDQLGRQPDPTQAPVRGVVRQKAATQEAAPVERRNLAAEAQDAAAKAEQIAYRDHLLKLAASPDNDTRMRAEAVLAQLLTP